MAAPEDTEQVRKGARVCSSVVFTDALVGLLEVGLLCCGAGGRGRRQGWGGKGRWKGIGKRGCIKGVITLHRTTLGDMRHNRGDVADLDRRQEKRVLIQHNRRRKARQNSEKGCPYRVLLGENLDENNTGPYTQRESLTYTL